jgi:hypothetical protein
VREIGAPRGQEPLEWVLLTNMAAESFGRGKTSGERLTRESSHP